MSIWLQPRGFVPDVGKDNFASSANEAIANKSARENCPLIWIRRWLAKVVEGGKREISSDKPKIFGPLTLLGISVVD